MRKVFKGHLHIEENNGNGVLLLLLFTIESWEFSLSNFVHNCSNYRFNVLENNPKVELNLEEIHKEDSLDRTNIQRKGGRDSAIELLYGHWRILVLQVHLWPRRAGIPNPLANLTSSQCPSSFHWNESVNGPSLSPLSFLFACWHSEIFREEPVLHLVFEELTAPDSPDLSYKI